MDGLTLSKAKDFVQSGKTFTELQKTKISPDLTSKTGENFKDTLTQAIEKVNEAQVVADQKMQQLASGESTNLSDVMISAERADIALKLMMSVRNKVIDAYQEIMKMQV